MRATTPGFLAQSSANTKAKETAPILSMHNTKQVKTMIVSSSFLTNDCIFVSSKIAVIKKKLTRI